MVDTHVSDVPAGSRGADRLHHGLLRADGLDDRVGAESIGELLDPGDALVAAFLDDVGGAELAGQGLPVGVAGHGDDPFGAELLGGQDAEQSDSAVADDGDGLTGADLGSNGGEPAGAEHVGGGQQDGIRSSSGMPGVATRVPSANGMRARSDWVPMVPGTNSACTHRDW